MEKTEIKVKTRDGEEVECGEVHLMVREDGQKMSNETVQVQVDRGGRTEKTGFGGLTASTVTSAETEAVPKVEVPLSEPIIIPVPSISPPPCGSESERVAVDSGTFLKEKVLEVSHFEEEELKLSSDVQNPKNTFVDNQQITDGKGGAVAIIQNQCLPVFDIMSSFTEMNVETPCQQGAGEGTSKCKEEAGFGGLKASNVTTAETEAVPEVGELLSGPRIIPLPSISSSQCGSESEVITLESRSSPKEKGLEVSHFEEEGLKLSSDVQNPPNAFEHDQQVADGKGGVMELIHNQCLPVLDKMCPVTELTVETPCQQGAGEGTSKWTEEEADFGGLTASNVTTAEKEAVPEVGELLSEPRIIPVPSISPPQCGSESEKFAVDSGIPLKEKALEVSHFEGEELKLFPDLQNPPNTFVGNQQITDGKGGAVAIIQNQCLPVFDIMSSFTEMNVETPCQQGAGEGTSKCKEEAGFGGLKASNVTTAEKEAVPEVGELHSEPRIIPVPSISPPPCGSESEQVAVDSGTPLKEKVLEVTHFEGEGLKLFPDLQNPPNTFVDNQQITDGKGGAVAIIQNQCLPVFDVINSFTELNVETPCQQEAGVGTSKWTEEEADFGGLKASNVTTAETEAVPEVGELLSGPRIFPLPSISSSQCGSESQVITLESRSSPKEKGLEVSHFEEEGLKLSSDVQNPPNAFEHDQQVADGKGGVMELIHNQCLPVLDKMCPVTELTVETPRQQVAGEGTSKWTEEEADFGGLKASNVASAVPEVGELLSEPIIIPVPVDSGTPHKEKVLEVTHFEGEGLKLFPDIKNSPNMFVDNHQITDGKGGALSLIQNQCLPVLDIICPVTELTVAMPCQQEDEERTYTCLDACPATKESTMTVQSLLCMSGPSLEDNIKNDASLYLTTTQLQQSLEKTSHTKAKGKVIVDAAKTSEALRQTETPANTVMHTSKGIVDADKKTAILPVNIKTAELKYLGSDFTSPLESRLVDQSFVPVIPKQKHPKTKMSLPMAIKDQTSLEPELKGHCKVAHPQKKDRKKNAFLAQPASYPQEWDVGPFYNCQQHNPDSECQDSNATEQRSIGTFDQSKKKRNNCKIKREMGDDSSLEMTEIEAPVNPEQCKPVQDSNLSQSQPSKKSKKKQKPKRTSSLLKIEFSGAEDQPIDVTDGKPENNSRQSQNLVKSFIVSTTGVGVPDCSTSRNETSEVSCQALANDVLLETATQWAGKQKRKRKRNTTPISYPKEPVANVIETTVKHAVKMVQTLSSKISVEGIESEQKSAKLINPDPDCQVTQKQGFEMVNTSTGLGQKVQSLQKQKRNAVRKERIQADLEVGEYSKAGEASTGLRTAGVVKKRNNRKSKKDAEMQMSKQLSVAQHKGKDTTDTFVCQRENENVVGPQNINNHNFQIHKTKNERKGKKVPSCPPETQLRRYSSTCSDISVDPPLVLEKTISEAPIVYTVSNEFEASNFVKQKPCRKKKLVKNKTTSQDDVHEDVSEANSGSIIADALIPNRPVFHKTQKRGRSRKKVLEERDVQRNMQTISEGISNSFEQPNNNVSQLVVVPSSGIKTESEGIVQTSTTKKDVRKHRKRKLISRNCSGELSESTEHGMDMKIPDPASSLVIPQQGGCEMIRTNTQVAKVAQSNRKKKTNVVKEETIEVTSVKEKYRETEKGRTGHSIGKLKRRIGRPCKKKTLMKMRKLLGPSEEQKSNNRDTSAFNELTNGTLHQDIPSHQPPIKCKIKKLSKKKKQVLSPPVTNLRRSSRACKLSPVEKIKDCFAQDHDPLTLLAISGPIDSLHVQKGTISSSKTALSVPEVSSKIEAFEFVEPKPQRRGRPPKNKTKSQAVECTDQGRQEPLLTVLEDGTGGNAEIPNSPVFTKPQKRGYRGKKVLEGEIDCIQKNVQTIVKAISSSIELQSHNVSQQALVPSLEIKTDLESAFETSILPTKQNVKKHRKQKQISMIFPEELVESTEHNADLKNPDTIKSLVIQHGECEIISVLPQVDKGEHYSKNQIKLVKEERMEPTLVAGKDMEAEEDLSGLKTIAKLKRKIGRPRHKKTLKNITKELQFAVEHGSNGMDVTASNQLENVANQFPLEIPSHQLKRYKESQKVKPVSCTPVRNLRRYRQACKVTSVDKVEDSCARNHQTILLATSGSTVFFPKRKMSSISVVSNESEACNFGKWKLHRQGGPPKKKRKDQEQKGNVQGQELMFAVHEDEARDNSASSSTGLSALNPNSPVTHNPRKRGRPLKKVLKEDTSDIQENNMQKMVVTDLTLEQQSHSVLQQGLVPPQEIKTDSDRIFKTSVLSIKKNGKKQRKEKIYSRISSEEVVHSIAHSADARSPDLANNMLIPHQDESETIAQVGKGAQTNLNKIKTVKEATSLVGGHRKAEEGISIHKTVGTVTKLKRRLGRPYKRKTLVKMAKELAFSKEQRSDATEISATNQLQNHPVPQDFPSHQAQVGKLKEISKKSKLSCFPTSITQLRRYRRACKITTDYTYDKIDSLTHNFSASEYCSDTLLPFPKMDVKQEFKPSEKDGRFPLQSTNTSEMQSLSQQYDKKLESSSLLNSPEEAKVFEDTTPFSTLRSLDTGMTPEFQGMVELNSTGLVTKNRRKVKGSRKVGRRRRKTWWDDRGKSKQLKNQGTILQIYQAQGKIEAVTEGKILDEQTHKSMLHLSNTESLILGQGINCKDSDEPYDTSEAEFCNIHIEKAGGEKSVDEGQLADDKAVQQASGKPLDITPVFQEIDELNSTGLVTKKPRKVKDSRKAGRRKRRKTWWDDRGKAKLLLTKNQGTLLEISQAQENVKAAVEEKLPDEQTPKSMHPLSNTESLIPGQGINCKDSDEPYDRSEAKFCNIHPEKAGREKFVDKGQLANDKTVQQASGKPLDMTPAFQEIDKLKSTGLVTKKPQKVKDSRKAGRRRRKRTWWDDRGQAKQLVTENMGTILEISQAQGNFEATTEENIPAEQTDKSTHPLSNTKSLIHGQGIISKNSPEPYDISVSKFFNVLPEKAGSEKSVGDCQLPHNTNDVQQVFENLEVTSKIHCKSLEPEDLEVSQVATEQETGHVLSQNSKILPKSSSVIGDSGTMDKLPQQKPEAETKEETNTLLSQTESAIHSREWQNTTEDLMAEGEVVKIRLTEEQEAAPLSIADPLRSKQKRPKKSKCQKQAPAAEPRILRDRNRGGIKQDTHGVNMSLMKISQPCHEVLHAALESKTEGDRKSPQSNIKLDAVILTESESSNAAHSTSSEVLITKPSFEVLLNLGVEDSLVFAEMEEQSLIIKDVEACNSALELIEPVFSEACSSHFSVSKSVVPQDQQMGDEEKQDDGKGDYLEGVDKSKGSNHEEGPVEKVTGSNYEEGPVEKVTGSNHEKGPVDKVTSELNPTIHSSELQAPGLLTKKGKHPAKCHFCGRSFRHITAYIFHRRIHTGEKPYRCQDCGKGFAQLFHLNAHRKVHKLPGHLQCPLCINRFSHKDKLLAHFLTHTNDLNKKNLKMQTNTHFSKSATSVEACKPFKCIDCKKQFRYSSTLKSHRCIHKEDQLVSCKVCGKTFNQASNLSDHEKLHWPVKPYACSVCGKGFSQLGALKTHSRTHTGEKPFSCANCGDDFLQLSSLRTHQASKVCLTKGAGEDGNNDRIEDFFMHQGVEGQVNPPEIFECQICSKSYDIQSEYNLHLLMHSDVQTSVPDACGQQCNQTSDHTGYQQIDCILNGKESPNASLFQVCNTSEILCNQPAQSLIHQQTLLLDKQQPQCEESLPNQPEHTTKSTNTLPQSSSKSAQLPALCQSSSNDSELVRTATGRYFKNPKGLQGYMVTHTPRYSYTCGRCGKALENWNKYWLHQRVHRKETGGFNCPQCRRHFLFHGLYTEHMLEHAKQNPYACPICPIAFADEEGLKEHQREGHEACKTHKCHTCGKNFIHPENLKRHNLLHGGARPRSNCLGNHKCRECNASFKTSDLLGIHQLRHSAGEGILRDESEIDTVSDLVPPVDLHQPQPTPSPTPMPPSAPIRTSNQYESLYDYPHPDNLYVYPTPSTSFPPPVLPSVTNVHHYRSPSQMKSSNTYPPVRFNAPHFSQFPVCKKEDHPHHLHSVPNQTCPAQSLAQSTAVLFSTPQPLKLQPQPHATTLSLLSTNRLSLHYPQNQASLNSQNTKMHSVVKSKADFSRAPSPYVKLKNKEEMLESLGCAECGTKFGAVSELYEHYIQHARGEV